jgi:2-succinyl-6-hydroxy-2,4-cyclohexadiene-1-carboxylate synthase
VIRRADRWGEGTQPALLLHGFTHTGRAWRRFEAAWGKALSVLAPDLPGHGQSSEPLPSSFEAAVDALAEAIEREWHRPADVVGYSQGARLALALAIRHPTQVRRLVVESGSPGVGFLSSEAARAHRRSEDAALADKIETLGVAAFIREWEALPLFAGLRGLSQSEQETLRSLREGHRPGGLAAALRLLGKGSQPDYSTALPQLALSTLFIAGIRDEKFRRLAEEMAAAVPHSRLALFDCGHAPHLEAPGYGQAVLDFLS